MPTEKKDSKPKKAVKKSTKSSKITKAVKAKDLDKVITESIIPNEIIYVFIINRS